MTNRNKLLKSIERTQFAYKLYLKNKKYIQANRLYNANKEIYNLLQEFLYECKPEESEVVCQYIFHLEDWFLQFDSAKETIQKLDESFVFLRLDGGIPFPVEILEILRK